MRNFFFGFLIILGAVLVTHTANNSTLRGNSSNSGGSGTTTVSTRAVACTAVAESPVRSGTSVVADGRFGCDSPGADNLWMTVTMQKEASKTDWVTVATSSFHSVGAATSSSASSESRTHGVSATCATGTFRTVIEMTSESKGGTKSTKSQSGAVTNPCA